MPAFKYDPAIGSFKAWLLNMTRWRIISQFRKRQPGAEHRPSAAGSTTRTATVEAAPDPNAPDLDAMWEAEWQTNLLNAAMDIVKRRMDPHKFQIFDFYVNKGWSPEKVAERFGVSADQVYQIKHRVTETIRAEVGRLEKDMT